MGWFGRRVFRSLPSWPALVCLAGILAPVTPAAFAAGLPSSPADGPGILIPLSFERYPDDQSASAGRRTMLTLQETPPDGHWVLPVWVGEKPLFGILRIGSREHLVAIDRQDEQSPFYDRLYIDLGLHGDLTKTPPLLGEARLQRRSTLYECTFPPLDLDIVQEGHLLPYCVAIQVRQARTAERIFFRDDDANIQTSVHLTYSPHCAYSGEAVIDGAPYSFTLLDQTSNGRFDDRGRLSTHSSMRVPHLLYSGDALQVTRAGENSPVRFLLGDALAIGNRLFDLHIDIPSGWLRLEPRSHPVGLLAFPYPVRAMGLLHETGSVMVYQAAEQVLVPAGEWRLQSYEMNQSDEWGDIWSIQARGSANTAPLHILEDTTTVFPGGEPLQAAVSIAEAQLNNAVSTNSLRMSFRILGDAGEDVVNIQHDSGTNTQHKRSGYQLRRPAPPTFQIIRPNGERVFSGSFEYG